jgi:hypothetical protein
VGPFWPQEIRLVLGGYASIDLPFEELTTPEFEMREEWTLGRFLGFARTWSGVGRFCEEYGEDPVHRLAAQLEGIWGNGTLPISWGLDLRVGRV